MKTDIDQMKKIFAQQIEDCYDLDEILTTICNFKKIFLKEKEETSN